MRQNFRSIEDSIKESSKQSADLADKKEMLKYPVTVDAGQERARVCHAITIPRQ